MYYQTDCELHGKVNHELELVEYLPLEHTVISHSVCLECYNNAKFNDGKYAYNKYYLAVEEWNKIVRELQGCGPTLN